MDPRENPRHRSGPHRREPTPLGPDPSVERRAAPGPAPGTGPGPAPVQVVVRNPADLLACVALALGFVPERSVVLLALPPGQGPHARVDLVEDLADVPAMAQALVRPAVQHAVRRVALVVLENLPWATRVASMLEDAFEAAGIEVAALVAADGERWLSVLRGQRTQVPREYDTLSHPFVADAVVRGQVVLASRQAVRASVEPDPAFVEEVARATRPGGAPSGGPGPDAAWVRRTLGRHLRAGSSPSAAEVARLVTSLDDPACRDAAWAWAERPDARAHVDLWLRVVRGCPDGRVGPAAAVLAFHAWLAGDGALAWCALDRGRTGRRLSLARLVEDLLESAASPALWMPQLDPGSGEPSPYGRPVADLGDVAEVVDLAAVRRAGERRGPTP